MDKQINTRIHTYDNFKSIIWTKQEDIILIQKAKEFNYRNWKKVSSFLNFKGSLQCKSRFNKIISTYKKGTWLKEEDEILKKMVKIHGKHWSKLSKIIKTRSRKQIRDRYLNILDPTLNKSKFSEEEDTMIITMYKIHGSSWSKISHNFKGRTAEGIKNRFYSVLRKKYLIHDFKSKEENHSYEKIDNFSNSSENTLLNEAYNIIDTENCKINSLLEGIDSSKLTSENLLSRLNNLLICSKTKLEEYKKLKRDY